MAGPTNLFYQENTGKLLNADAVHAALLESWKTWSLESVSRDPAVRTAACALVVHLLTQQKVKKESKLPLIDGFPTGFLEVPLAYAARSIALGQPQGEALLTETMHAIRLAWWGTPNTQTSMDWTLRSSLIKILSLGIKPSYLAGANFPINMSALTQGLTSYSDDEIHALVRCLRNTFFATDKMSDKEIFAKCHQKAILIPAFEKYLISIGLPDKKAKSTTKYLVDAQVLKLIHSWIARITSKKLPLTLSWIESLKRKNMSLGKVILSLYSLDYVLSSKLHNVSDYDRDSMWGWLIGTSPQLFRKYTSTIMMMLNDRAVTAKSNVTKMEKMQAYMVGDRSSATLSHSYGSGASWMNPAGDLNRKRAVGGHSRR